MVTVFDGGIAAILILLVLKHSLGASEEIFPVDWSISKIYNWIVTYPIFFVFLTAIIYGLFTDWGFFRYHFINLKWILLFLMFILNWFVVGPALNGMASLSDTFGSNSQV